MMVMTMAVDDDDNEVDGNGATGDKVDDDGVGGTGNKADDDGNGATSNDNHGDGAPCMAKTRSRYLNRPNI